MRRRGTRIMDELELDLDDDTLETTEKRASPQDSRRQSLIEARIRILIHACQCRDANCELPRASCQRMKRVVRHTKTCKLKYNGDCRICYDLITVCFYHAKFCQDTNCAVPICSGIKKKIELYRVQRGARLGQLLRRNSRAKGDSGSGSPPTSGALSPSSSAVPSSALLSSSSNIQDSPPGLLQPNTALGQANPQVINLPQPPNAAPPQEEKMILDPGCILSDNPDSVAPPSIGTQGMPQSNNPLGTNTVSPCTLEPRQALQQLVQTLRQSSSSQQQDQILQILKKYPQLTAAYIKERQQQAQAQQQQDLSQSAGLPGASQQQQLVSQLPQQQMFPIPGDILSQNTVCVAPPTTSMQVMPQANDPLGTNIITPGAMAPRHALHQLVQTLRQPSSTQQQDQILQILKTHPQLMAAFIKQRQQQPQKQPQHSSPSAGLLGTLPQQRQIANQALQQHTIPNPRGILSQNPASVTLSNIGMQVMPQPNKPLGTNTIRPGTMAPRRALQQLVQALRQPRSSQQQDQILQILKTHPQLMAAFIKQRQQQARAQQQQPQKQPQHSSPSAGLLGTLPQQRQIANQALQQHTIPNPRGILSQNPASVAPSNIGMQVMPQPNKPLGTNTIRPGTMAPRRALQQLVQALRQPSSSQQQDQILQILKRHPQLMAAFLKQRQRQAQAQQQ